VTGLRGPVVVTGTDTGVGKTIVTAAIAAAAAARGLSVAVVKPAQTGVGPGEESDVETVVRLAAPATAVTGTSYPDPLAPGTAARVAGRAPIELAAVAADARARASEHDLVLVEGAGGLLVPMGPPGPDGPNGAAGWTVADLAVRLDAPTVVVVRAGLGTLNHTALTLEALRRRDVPALVVVGAWPAAPELVHRTNLADLTAVGPVAGAVPDGAGALSRAEFTERAPTWLAPPLHGTFDPAALAAVVD
jgi:dethiobiotin synthetase